MLAQHRHAFICFPSVSPCNFRHSLMKSKLLINTGYNHTSVWKYMAQYIHQRTPSSAPFLSGWLQRIVHLVIEAYRLKVMSILKTSLTFLSGYPRYCYLVVIAPLNLVHTTYHRHLLEGLATCSCLVMTSWTMANIRLEPSYVFSWRAPSALL